LPVLVGAVVLVGAIAAVTLVGSRPALAPHESVAVYEGENVGGSAIVHDCFAVDDQTCLTATPSLHKALEKLAATTEGPGLLATAARAGVALRVATLGNNIDAAFEPKSRSITLDTSAAGMSARAQAAVLANELRFVSIWAGPAGILPHTGLTCIQEETSALATEMAVWKQLRGDTPPADALESAEDKLAQALDSRGVGFWADQAMKSRANCG
jgi:hypothetical protein